MSSFVLNWRKKLTDVWNVLRARSDDKFDILSELSSQDLVKDVHFNIHLKILLITETIIFKEYISVFGHVSAHYLILKQN